VPGTWSPRCSSPAAGPGTTSHGRHYHVDAPHSISFVIIHTKYNKGHLNDSTSTARG
jgi:hypothetical protein